MSQTEVAIKCPNCGFLATHAYCAKCGQPTHLHKETFWGLVKHFFGHYFHYDSKFWQSMKALWFSPGKLTIAYTNRQRMRYVAPISLYIFISAVYFLTSFATGNGFLTNHENEHTEQKVAPPTQEVQHVNNENAPKGKEEVFRSNDFGNFEGYLSTGDNSRIERFLAKKADKIRATYGSTGKFFHEKIDHDMPKIFFFMIPMMAGLLKLFYLRRGDLFFVDHAIFSIHYHSFWFSLFTIRLLGSLNSMQWLLSIMLFIAFSYMVIALHNVYRSGWARSVVNTFSMSLLYSICWFLTFMLYIMLVMAVA